MIKNILFVLALSLGVTAAVVPVAEAQKGGSPKPPSGTKVKICHIADTQYDRARTLALSQEEANLHLTTHPRDYAGACDCQGQDTSTCPAKACGINPICSFGRCDYDDLTRKGQSCRPADGPCDVAEACDGVSPDCPIDAVQAAGHECRAIQGDCDVAEVCDGASKACPQDGYAKGGTPCPDDGNPCTDDECAGSAECTHPNDNTNTCGNATPTDPACDQPDTCSEGTCLSNNAASGVACTDDGNPCTDDVCTGSGSCSHQNDNTNTCGSATPTDPDCDKADACVNGTCQSNNVAKDLGCKDDGNPCTKDVCTGSGSCSHPVGNWGAICRASTDLCDAAEVCDGVSSACPVDAFKPARTECRASQGVCDIAEYCSGFGSKCPADQKNRFVICREAVIAADGTTCDLPETCDGYSNDCPGDGVQPAGNLCRTATGINGPGTAGSACDVPELCDGQTNTCPTNQLLPVGTVCGEATECRGERTCKGTCNGLFIGTRCSSDTECASEGGKCYPIGNRIYACASPPINEGGKCDGDNGICESGTCTSRVKGFGETCDGDDFYWIGDPDKRHCGEDANGIDLVCCGGGGHAKAGTTGTCKQCCNNGYGEENGACPENRYNTQECCDGYCKDLGFDPDNCGTCGKKCSAYINECTDPDSVKCGKIEERCDAFGNCSDFPSPGVCILGSVCKDPDYPVCIPEVTAEEAHPTCDDCEDYRDCANYPLDPGEACIPRSYKLCPFPDPTACVTQVYSLDIDCPLKAHARKCIAATPTGHCGSCSSDSDCYDPDRCILNCTGSTATSGFTGIDCSGFGYCAATAEECNDDSADECN